MKQEYSKPIEAGRVTSGKWATSEVDRCGVFHAIAPNGQMLQILASDGADWAECGFGLPVWEHVSVSHARRCPTWEEMAWVKSQFWNDDECVLEFHPPRSEYVNNHPHCLHLWRPLGVDIPMPPSMAVGFRDDDLPAPVSAAS